MIPRILGALACAALLMPGAVRAEPPGGTAGWTLSFEDNFDGSSVDTAKWSVPTRQDGSPWCFQTPANALVSGGILTQVISRRDTSTYNVTELETLDRFEPVYGYIEARVKTSWAPSVWPSFWAVSRYGWPPELDIFENWGGQNATLSAQNWHYRNSGGGEQGDGKGIWTDNPPYWSGGWGADYHVYAANWQEGRIDFYIDGVLTHTSTKEITTLPMYIILSNGLGGAEHGSPDFSEGPADKYNSKVDYVRVWTKPYGTELSRSGWVASAFASGPWNPPSNAIDADPATKWGSGVSQAAGQWFQVDLGSAATFDTVVFKSYQNVGDAPAGVQVFVSDNGSSWGSALASKTDDATIQDLNTVILKFASQTKRYVRIVQTGARSNWWGIDDLRVYTAGAPTGGTAKPLVSRIQTEDYNPGGPSVGTLFPTADAGGGSSVGNVTNGSTLNYTVNVSAAGSYALRLRASSYWGTAAGAITVKLDGTTLASVAVPQTWNDDGFTDILVSSVSIPAGSVGANRLLAVVFAQGGLRLNWLEFSANSGLANGTYKIVNRNSGKALSVSGSSTADGAQIVQWDYNANADQKWTFTGLGGGVYQIVNVNSGKLMDIYGASSADGAANIQWPSNGGTNQKWILEDAGGGYFRIKNQNSGKVLDIESAATWNGARDIQWSVNGGWNQHWSITEP